MQWHFYMGYFCLGLIIFRIIWGVVGSYYSRFTVFIAAPTTTWRYLFGNTQARYIGHNPAGGYAIIVMLSLVLSQAISGLFISDEIFNDGPYYNVLSEQWQSIANFVHHNGFNAIMAITLLHVGTILYYKLKKKQALTKAMLTGYKTLSKADSIELKSKKPKPSPSFVWLSLRFLLCVAVVAAFVYCLVEVWPPEPVDDFFMY
jgi:cytochrome b